MYCNDPLVKVADELVQEDQERFSFGDLLRRDGGVRYCRWGLTYLSLLEFPEMDPFLRGT